MATSDVAVLVTTHNRTDDARATMEIVRGVWPRSQALRHVPIVHAYNGDPAWWPQPYLEDVLCRTANASTHFRGAADLLDLGMGTIADRFPDVRYVIALASDVWLYEPDWVAKVLAEMRTRADRLSTARWRIEEFADRLTTSKIKEELLPTDGLACDFFIVDVRWATEWGMFPLGYARFLDTYADLLNYAQEMPFLERHLAGRYLAAVRAELEGTPGGKDPWGTEGPRQAERQLRLMTERPIDPAGKAHPSHKGTWRQIGLVTVEDAATKRAIVRRNRRLTGATLDRLRRERDVSWFNQHVP